MKQWAEAVLQKLIAKEAATVERNRDCVPYRALNGAYEDLSGDEIGWWTNGFWGGILWQMYQLTQQTVYLQEAQKLEKKLDAVLLNARAMDHDSGFRWLPTAVMNYRLTGNPESYNRAILAADNLCGRFNPAGRFIRAWNDWGGEDHRGWAIIDCMMNLPLLCWASDETKDPRYRQFARMHADRTMECFIRPDGSARHIVSFDPDTGAYLEALGGQGYDAQSSWTRGQAWALYGFTLAYKHLADPRYLQTAERIAAYVLSAMDDTGLIPVDFRQPEDCDFEDSIAAAVLACGLIELSRMAEDGERYLQAALTILHALDEKRADDDPAVDGILTHCSAKFFEEDHDQKIVYGDYFYMEAFLKLTERNLTVW